MSERSFRLVLGFVLLLCLYFDLRPLVLALIAILIFEGVTNWRVPNLVSRLRYGGPVPMSLGDDGCSAVSHRINFDAERGLRLVVATLLILSYVAFDKQIWFLPWFIGFALIGAGLSGICPMVMALRWMGLK